MLLKDLQRLYLLKGNASFRKTSRSLEDAELYIKVMESFWNFSVPWPRHPSNFKALVQFETHIPGPEVLRNLVVWHVVIYWIQAQIDNACCISGCPVHVIKSLHILWHKNSFRWSHCISIIPEIFIKRNIHTDCTVLGFVVMNFLPLNFQVISLALMQLWWGHKDTSEYI